ncbi:Patched domain-containing protein 3, partial [Fasciola gigantica]
RALVVGGGGRDRSRAIRYVCNAFRDAQQYTVEFGVFRLPHESEKTSSARSPQKQYYEPSTLPNRTSHAKRFSTAYQLKTVHVSDAKEVEATQHQPRRVQPSRNSIISESVGIPNSPRRSYYNQVSPARFSASVESADTSTLSGAPTPPPRLASSPLLCVKRSSDSTNKSHGNEIYPVASPSTQPSGSVRGRASARSGFGASSSLRIHRRSCSGVALKDMNAFNTKAIGQRISIELNKVADGGLGFTLTRRDTQTNPEGNDPVYVKKILPTGAAVQDGRLLIGDRLLSVDGIDVCNLDQVLTQLRAIPAGRTVHLLVSRQVASQVDDLAIGRKSALSSVSQSAEDPDLNSVDLPPRPFRSFTFEFRLPTNLSGVSGKPTLGVNFKWNTFPPDLDESTASMYAPLPGLYVESLLPDGLVIQAERPTLLPGDRLVGLNGDSLDGLGAKVSRAFPQLLIGRQYSLPVYIFSV